MPLAEKRRTLTQLRTRGCLIVNGLGSAAAALFGSPFPTTIYIGHPGWKALGARAGYSVLNGAFVTIVALTGTLSLIAWAVPIDAGMAIVLWIGMVISAQAFQATPREHAPAVVVGLLPAIGAWGALMAKNGLRAAGVGTPGGPPFGPDLVEKFKPGFAITGKDANGTFHFPGVAPELAEWLLKERNVLGLAVDTLSLMPAQPARDTARNRATLCSTILFIFPPF